MSAIPANNISHSQVQLFEECPRKYSYQYRLRLANHTGISAAYSIALIHKPLGMLYDDPKATPDWGDLWTEYASMLDVDAELLELDPLYTLTMATAIFTQYRERLLTSTLEEYEVLGVEKSYTKAIFTAPDDTVYLCRPDVVLKKRSDDSVWVLDFKSSTRTQPAHGLTFHRQFLGQAWVTGADGWLVDAITLTRTKADKPRIVLSRHQTTLQTDHLKEFIDELGQVVAHRAVCDMIDVWPKHAPGSCYAYNRECEFMSLCEAGSTRRSLADGMAAKVFRK